MAPRIVDVVSMDDLVAVYCRTVCCYFGCLAACWRLSHRRLEKRGQGKTLTTGLGQRSERGLCARSDTLIELTKQLDRLYSIVVYDAVG